MNTSESRSVTKSLGATPFLLRMPVELSDHLRACATANYRSLTREILMRLDASVEGESISKQGVIVRRVASIEK